MVNGQFTEMDYRQTKQLRWAERDGEKVLQQKWIMPVIVDLHKPVESWDEQPYEWRDIPTEGCDASGEFIAQWKGESWIAMTPPTNNELRGDGSDEQ